MCTSGSEGETLHRQGVAAEIALRRSRGKATPASWAMARPWRTVLVEPPMAMSRVIAFMKAALDAMERGSTELSSLSYHAWAKATMSCAACSKRRVLRAWVAITVPLPGSASPRASLRQFIELAVNIPEQDPQVGHAKRSTRSTSASATAWSPAMTITSIRS